MPDGSPPPSPHGVDPAARAAMRARLDALRDRQADVASPETMADVVEAVLHSMRGALSAPEAALLSEVEQLGRTIAQAKQEIAALNMDDINGSFIPSATDELDAIVGATAAATNEILDCCDTIEATAGSLPPEAAEALRGVTTRIYEACSFQDITGQRVTKVVKTLKTIEDRINAIIGAFSDRVAVIPRGGPAPAPTGEAALLNGPQLAGGGVDQASIDALFD